MDHLPTERPDCLTAADLIEKLRAFPPTALIVVEGRNGGLSPLRAALRVGVLLDVNRDPDFGPHEIAMDDGDGTARAAVLLTSSQTSATLVWDI